MNRMGLCIAVLLMFAHSLENLAAAEDGRVRIAVADERGVPVPCRIHLFDKDGNPQQAEDLPFWRDHFVCPGNVEMSLPAGEYRVEIERGPEYAQYAGSLKVATAADEDLRVSLKRITDLAAKGWYSGDLHAHRKIEDMPLLNDHMLNCGLRVPPSAGSASGVLPNPLGYNRVYVFCGDDFSYDTWWEGLKAGRSFVTNGPLLLTKANGQLPGHVFTTPQQESMEIDIEVSLISRDRVKAIEIVMNGNVERSVSVSGESQTVRIDGLAFRQSGWFLVRVIADVERTFRFASTAPYYVEVGSDRHRVSRRSAKFFLDWVEERIGRVPQKLNDPSQLEEVLAHHEDAQEFWQRVLTKANTD